MEYRIYPEYLDRKANLADPGNGPGPSCSKHRLLNELASGQNVNCTSKSNI